MRAAQKSGRIVKWVDEKGVTHYGDSLPPEQTSKSSVVLDEKGTVVKKNDATLPPEERERLRLEKEKQERLAVEQERRDRIVLNAYSTEEDIDLAAERSVRLEESTIQALEVSLSSAQKKLEENNKFAAGLQARKKPLPADLTSDIESSKKDVSRIEGQLAQKRKEIATIREHYAEDKRRFRELKGYTVPAPATSAAPVARPNAPR
ncbi:MAG TPA: DUF4124 domain-containing protein [Methylophilaceae bacterium]|nr:DUF4124 domain-containing protein [Methylophilaceae bacterium]